MPTTMFSSTRSYEGILEQQRDPLNPINNTALKVRGGDVLTAMDKIQSHDEETHNSGSGSGSSDLSLLENETDEFGRLLLQHQRDAQRLSHAVRGGREQAFRKARPKPRVAERLEREERQAGQNHARRSSGGGNESDPPVTVPREWGRRARKQTDWLRKIVAPSEDGEEGVEHAIHRHETAYTGDLDWRNVADAPVQTVEHTPPSMRRHRYDATPSSLNHMNTTLKPGTDFEEQDFTAASFLASTPAPTRYHRKIDELARQEIEELENHAVTTRTLDLIDQHSPNTTLRRTSSSRLRERAIADSLRSPLTSPEKSSSPSRIPVRRQHLMNNKENMPFNSHENGDVKGPEEARFVNAKAQPVNINKVHKRPVHTRNDSMNLLKKLARVSSMSPSPGREKAMSNGMENRREADRDVDAAELGVNGDVADRLAEAHADTQSQSRHRDSKPKSEAKDDNLQDFVQWKPEQGAFIERTEAPTPQDTKNAVVAGAWVDTTLNADAQAVPITKDLADEVQIDTIVEGLARLKPGYPKSALEAIVREAKAERDAAGAQQFGESTIQSLEDIVHPDLDPTDPTITFDLGAGNLAEEENLDEGLALTQAEKDRRQEDLAMEAMNKHLRTARTSIKDANRGLRRVENRIETTAQEEPPHSTPSTTNKSNLVITTPIPNPSGTYCPTCGSPHTSVWKALYIELRSCFYTYAPTPHPHPLNKYLGFRIRLTKLGLFCLWFWIWYLSECTLCAYWCQPRFAYRMIGTGVYPDAPEFPFVIPTLFFRPVRWLWRPVLEALEAVFHAYFGEVEEEVVGFRLKGEDGMLTRVGFEEWIAAATATGSRVGRSVVDAVDEVGSMWDDEFLM